MKTKDLNLLAALDALLTEESVSGAAERMHLSTPAMSHTLARIREALGDPILVRAGRRMVPTARAVQLRGPVKRLMAEARALLTPGDGADLSEIERQFVIRAPEGISIVFGSVLSNALRQVMPLGSLRFVPESDGDASVLREGRVDLDIGLDYDRGSEIEVEPLFEQRLVGVVRNGHALLEGPLTTKRFAAERHVAVAPHWRNRGALDVALADSGHQRHVQLTVSSPYAALMAASRSDLVATVPARLAQSVQASLGLQVFKVPLTLPVERIVQAWHPRFAGDTAHAWLRKHMRQVLTSKTWAISTPPDLAPAVRAP